MAMTLGRWISATLIACTIIAAALLRPTTQPTNNVGSWWLPIYGDVTRRASTSVDLRVANERLRTIELRDSIAPTLAHARYENGLAVIADPRVSESVRNDLLKTVRQQWASVRAKSASHTAVVLMLDTEKVAHGYPRSSIGGTIAIDVAPAVEGNLCLSIVRVGMKPEALPAKQRTKWLEGLRDRAGASSLLGPCSFIAEHGLPGKGVALWLSSTGWLGARNADWTSLSKPIERADLYARGPIDGLMGMTASWRLREMLSPNAMACLGGRSLECRLSLVERRRDVGRDDRWIRSGIASARYVPMNPWLAFGYGGLGPSEGWLLSDMRHDLGAERFEKFWTSSATVATAFQSASGERIEVWVRRWLERTYGEEALGPSLPWRSAAMGGGAILAAIALAALVAARRRVG